MRKKHNPTRPMKKLMHPQTIALGLLCIISSFSIGIRTAGNVETIAPSQAEGTQRSGDINLDGVITLHDAIELLEIAEGYTTPTPEQLLADPNGDGQLTVEDAIRLLYDIGSL